MRGRRAKDFNPRAPHGARLDSMRNIELMFDISIHAPLTGRDVGGLHIRSDNSISIHAPLTGRDA